MEDCIFCKIIKGEIPSKEIYEDEYIKVIMDINPKSNGHMLVLPIKHYENILDIDNDTLIKIVDFARKSYSITNEKLGSSGLTLVNNNGEGQDVKHFHLHLIPRFEGEKIDMVESPNIEYVEKIYNKFMD